MAPRKQWRNRIVGEGLEAPDQLLANPFNWRVHPAFQQEALDGSLNEIGWIQRVIVNQRSGHVVDGHLRVSLALKYDEPAVPVLYVDLTEEEEQKALLVLDPISARAATDKVKLEELLQMASTEDAGLQAMFDEMAQEIGAGPGGGKDKGEYDIGPELYERHDYLLFYFDNEFDWQVAMEGLGVATVRGGKVGNKTLDSKGVGRVLPGAALVALLKGTEDG